MTVIITTRNPKVIWKVQHRLDVTLNYPISTKNCPFLWGSWTFILGPTRPQQHLDQVSWFSRIHGRYKRTDRQKEHTAALLANAAMQLIIMMMTIITPMITFMAETIQEFTCFSQSPCKQSASQALYTVGHKKTCPFYFFDNSGKYWRIFIIFSILYSGRNCGIRAC